MLVYNVVLIVLHISLVLHNGHALPNRATKSTVAMWSVYRATNMDETPCVNHARSC